MRAITCLSAIALGSLGASSTTAQQAGPSPSPSESPSPVALPAPFPWPTLLPPEQVPIATAFQPAGPPTASTTRHGIKVELWLSSASVAPGEWVQAVVRTTNLGDEPAWSAPGSCDQSGTRVDVKLDDVIPRGVAQTGNAAKFKEKAIRDSGVRTHGFQRWRSLPRSVTASTGTAWAECTGSWVAHKLRARGHTVERFAWYPHWTYNSNEMPIQPLPPGMATVTVRWPFVSRGAEPERNQVVQPPVDVIGLSVPLMLTGDGPGTPSIPELVDRALADPEWAAWVDKDADRSSWSYVWAVAWAGPEYPGHPLWAGIVDPNPWGIMTLELIQGRLGAPGTRGVIHLDPWTGEVLDVAFQ